MHTVDPDVIVGHNFVGFDLDVLLHRMSRLKIPQWSKLGRLRRTQMPKLQANAGGMGQATWGEKQTMAGRLICDTYIAAKENLRETTYTLTELTRTQLGKVMMTISLNNLVHDWLVLAVNSHCRFLFIFLLCRLGSASLRCSLSATRPHLGKLNLGPLSEHVAYGAFMNDDRCEMRSTSTRFPSTSPNQTISCASLPTTRTTAT